MRLVSDLSGRFKDLEVLREEKLTKTLRKMTNSLSLRQCHFSKQCNLLFSKYFEQIFSSPVNQIRDAFSLYLNTVQRGKREPESQKVIVKGRPEFAMCRWGEGEYSKKRVSCLGYTGLEKIRIYFGNKILLCPSK